MIPSVDGFFDEATHTISYLIADPATKAAAIVDPVLDFDPKAARVSTGSADALLAAAQARGLDLHWILETHAHADHLSGADYLRAKTGAKVVIGVDIEAVQKAFGDMFEAKADGRVFDRLVREGDVLPLGDLQIEVLQTPGHTPACVTYRVGDAAFVGDTLFMPDYGTARADFPGGDAATLYRSIRRILALPPQTRIFVGHDYLPEGRETFAWETTVAAERAGNVHVREGVGEAEFVSMREARDVTLAAPTLILPSLQVNIRAGALPDPSPSGRVFLRLPLNAL
ncbi:MBL fold metallo-hydrolase [Phenylobacterium sp. 58.2.17]|jgi:glyoxylase-like metal-dependent hydrolase (beta-lactamase superfamily II)|uniref:MBL fold metallo-hydrolase n=1 Tax=Phenylobacterium sp. 58.2.17 TaxID=2969306 RepID=UPI00086C5400|nr:MBL fold metallo-hydrolase [Phenylobacterium sp. 58.2.17]MCX7586296.1 MBL fold metallo-hydrolase [Phenylobacterium sp. 58.2.17]ODT57461.1 MAG: MBL fold metallo-hydrolase [Phenylobacterium sp. SCN 69-14]